MKNFARWVAILTGIGLTLKLLAGRRTPQHEAGFTAKRSPLNRRLVRDAAYIASRKHPIGGLIEMDVSTARRLIEQRAQQPGEKLSFTAFILACIGQAVEQDKRLHAYRDWRGRVILFDDVDVTIAIEIEIDGHKFPLVHIMRGVNRRSVQDLHDEIRRIQSKPDRSQQNSFIRYFPLLPRLIRRMAYRWLTVNPHLQKRFAGTVGLTSVGMFGDGSGWALGMPAHTLSLIVGSITEKPVVVEGEIAVREIMNMTLYFDHDHVDGAPAARFTARLKSLIESGHGLNAFEEETP